MQACYLEVSEVMSTWRGCDIKQQQETYPGGSTDMSALYVQRQEGSVRPIG
jgi:hypothetical protein